MRGIEGYYVANRRISVEELAEVFDKMTKLSPKQRRQPRDIEKSRRHNR